MISRIDHLSIAVTDHEQARRFFQDILGAVEGASDEHEELQFFWQVFSLGDLSRIELISPTGPQSFLHSFLEDRQGGVHHLTLETPNLQKAMEDLKSRGIPYFGYNEYPDGIWKEIYIHPRDAFGVLIQIAEFRPDDFISDRVKLPASRRWKVEKKAGGCALALSHPGGGMVKVELDDQEARALLAELGQALEG